MAQNIVDIEFFFKVTSQEILGQVFCVRKTLDSSIQITRKSQVK